MSCKVKKCPVTPLKQQQRDTEYCVESLHCNSQIQFDTDDDTVLYSSLEHC